MEVNKFLNSRLGVKKEACYEPVPHLIKSDLESCDLIQSEAKNSALFIKVSESTISLITQVEDKLAAMMDQVKLNLTNARENCAMYVASLQKKIQSGMVKRENEDKNAFSQVEIYAKLKTDILYR